ncbi:subclass B3 metallo-beta-lactamase [Chitinophaga silvatica]|uniref:Subclass B3 metallo-beta-lactamase n=1 Tax=Chitinophaga silvatica TaxID=2282649 RepID=A0A3E1Y6P7_9BACT|nr:subclass B3 metallo-beta-lactamase [Chitinophaga silvatica]
MKRNLLTLLLALPVLTLFAQNVREPKGQAEWSKPYQPFRIAGNLYYVGTYDLASYLIVTPQGNILINTGLASSESQIKKNIQTLGFKLSDTKILLTTQAHFDHLGAMAAIKKQTKAKFYVDEGDKEVVLDGGKSDYAFGTKVSSFAPVAIDKVLHDGDIISLGGMDLKMLHHPGHTKGSCSFLFDVKDGAKTYKVLIANFPSIVTEKKFSEVTKYPDIANDYAYTLISLKQQSFDLWLASHASQFGLHEKHKPGDAYNPAAFKDYDGYRKAVKYWEDAYNAKIAKE